MSQQRRVFVSAASTEFRPLRERLAAVLLRSGINVEYQEIFPQTASDTVRKLGDLVRESSLLVHVVGHDPGSVADAMAVADLLDGIPVDELLSHMSDLRTGLGDFAGITYTQWEAWLALHHRVPMLVYAVADAREADTRALRKTFSQRAHLEQLTVARRYPQYCADEADLVGKILADVHRHFGLSPSAVKPQNLPYASLGTLFKGRDAFLTHLRAQLARGATTVIRAQQAIHGMGGVGKTRHPSRPDSLCDVELSRVVHRESHTLHQPHRRYRRDSAEIVGPRRAVWSPRPDRHRPPTSLELHQPV